MASVIGRGAGSLVPRSSASPLRIRFRLHSGSNAVKVTRDEGGGEGIRRIRIDRPKSYNSFNGEVYKDLAAALSDAGKDWPRTKVTVLEANTLSPYYSSGNDLKEFKENFLEAGGEVEKVAKQSSEILQEVVSSFIRFGPGLLVAAVHGPALGIAFTTLALCDVVFASDSARFSAPFTKLGQAPEGCSSVTFPQMMGDKKAIDCLAFGITLTAQEARELGLVTDVFPEAFFKKEVDRKVRNFASLPHETVEMVRNMSRLRQKENVQVLDKANQTECLILEERWQSRECAEALAAFAGSRRS